MSVVSTAPPSVASGRSSVAKKPTDRLPKLAGIALFAMLFPVQFELAGLLLNPSRIVFLIVTVPLFFRLMAGVYGRVLPPDIMVTCFAFWSTLSIFVNNPDGAVAFAGSQGITLMGAYLVARTQIRTLGAFVRMSKLLTLYVLFTLPFALIEGFTDARVILDFLDSLPVVDSLEDALSSPRLGLHRAQVLFAHPIHYGLFASLAVPSAFLSLSRPNASSGNLLMGLILTGAVFMSVSSGPFLAVFFMIGLLMWARVFRKLDRPFLLFLLMCFLMYIPLEVFSDRPALVALLSYLAFDPNTAYTRVLIYEFASAQVWRTPFLGIGFNEYPRPAWFPIAGIDNFWLLNAVTFGLVGMILLLGAFLVSLYKVAMRKFERGSQLNKAQLAWCITLSGILFSLATVAVWGPFYSLVMFYFASGLWMWTYDAGSDEATAEDGPEDEAARGTVYTRFPAQSGGTQGAGQVVNP